MNQSKNNHPKSSLFEKKYLYLQAVTEVKPELKKNIDAALATFAQYVTYPVLEKGELVGDFTFELADSFNHRKEQDILEEVAGEMNRFHEEAVKKNVS